MSVRVLARAPRFLGLALVAVLATAARGDDTAIVVASAISMREPLAVIAQDFETAHPGVRVDLTFGASRTMATQVRAGAPIDVLLAADERIVDDLVASGDADGASQRRFARNRLVVVLAAGFAAEIESPEDLQRPDVRRIAIPEPSVPLGSYARAWLRSVDLLDAIRPRIVPTAHARATLAAAEGGLVDLAIVYASDARLLRHARIAFEIPPADSRAIYYAAVRVRDSKHPELSEDFLTALGSEATRSLLRDAGFATP